MNYLHFSRAIICVLCIFSTGLMAQNTFEQLPRHQVNASFGKASTTAFEHPNLSKLNTGGLAYTYNVSRKLWLSAELQTGFGRFDWETYETSTGLATGGVGQAATEIPVFYPKTLNYYQNTQPVFTNVPIALLPPKGFYEFRNLALIGGYQRSSARNALRFGLGVSATPIHIRRITFAYGGANTDRALLELKTLIWSTNAAIQYDYWLTPQVCVGMRLTSMFQLSADAYHHYTALLSMGYAIPRLRKVKTQPRA